MINVSDIRIWLSEKNIEENFGLSKIYDAKIVTKEEKIAGVYNLSNSNPFSKYIGIKRNDYEIGINLLIHYTKKYAETEDIGNKILKFLGDLDVKDLIINNHKITMIELLSGNEDVGYDEENNIYERVIQFKLYYMM